MSKKCELSWGGRYLRGGWLKKKESEGKETLYFEGMSSLVCSRDPIYNPLDSSSISPQIYFFCRPLLFAAPLSIAFFLFLFLLIFFQFWPFTKRKIKKRKLIITISKGKIIIALLPPSCHISINGSLHHWYESLNSFSCINID